MRAISYLIKGASAHQTEDISGRLEALPLVEKAEVVYNKATESCTAVIKLRCEYDVDDHIFAEVDASVKELLAQDGLVLAEEGTPLAKTYVTAPMPKEGKKVPLSAAVGALITAVILAVLITFGLTTLTHKDATADAQKPAQTNQDLEVFRVLDLLFDAHSPMDIDKDARLDAVLKAYVAASGDRYAEYFNEQEFKDFASEQKGEMSGIGINVVNGHVTIGGEEWQAILVANVYANSPAEESGVMPGDAIVYVGKGEDKTAVQTIGYTQALDMLKGEVGTTADFVVYRSTGESEAPYEIVEFNVVRRKITTQSVTALVCQTNDKVGVVRITGFDDTTAPQLAEAIGKLQGEGCEKFVLDLRGNPGGGLTSVIDVLTYFLKEGDVILTAKNKYGQEDIYTVGAPDSKGYVQSGSKKLTAGDVGKFKDLTFAVLVNEYSASAAELFTANIRDYELGQVVGTTTYGKGTMQQTYSLSQYGYEGALKLTTKYYYPPSGEGYDGVGIIPHHEVALSEEAASYNINLLPHKKDNQLQEAIRILIE